MEAPTIQSFCDAVMLNIKTCAKLGLPCRQKHHLTMELAARRYLKPLLNTPGCACTPSPPLNATPPSITLHFLLAALLRV